MTSGAAASLCGTPRHELARTQRGIVQAYRAGRVRKHELAVAGERGREVRVGHLGLEVEARGVDRQHRRPVRELQRRVSGELP